MTTGKPTDNQLMVNPRASTGASLHPTKTFQECKRLKIISRMNPIAIDSSVSALPSRNATSGLYALKFERRSCKILLIDRCHGLALALVLYPNVIRCHIAIAIPRVDLALQPVQSPFSRWVDTPAWSLRLLGSFPDMPRAKRFSLPLTRFL